MGYIKHNAIIVTGWMYEDVLTAREKAVKIFNKNFAAGILANDAGNRMVSPIMEGVANSQYAFFISPDGSKEGWGTSNRGDESRQEFCDWIKSSSLYLDFVDIRFGGDDEQVSIEQSNKH